MTGYSLRMLIKAMYRKAFTLSPNLGQKQQQTEMLCLTTLTESPDLLPSNVFWNKCSISAAAA